MQDEVTSHKKRLIGNNLHEASSSTKKASFNDLSINADCAEDSEGNDGNLSNDSTIYVMSDNDSGDNDSESPH